MHAAAEKPNPADAASSLVCLALGKGRGNGVLAVGCNYWLQSPRLRFCLLHSHGNGDACQRPERCVQQRLKAGELHPGKQTSYVNQVQA